MACVAVIDIGTVSVRLAVASFSDGRLGHVDKLTRICDLGEGVSATRRISNAAILRVVRCVDDYLAHAREAGATVAACTLTSAARDATNAVELLSALSERGLIPQVIPGDVEGSLTFLGVARDFVGTRLLVADNGGGSTEFALGSLDAGAAKLDFVRSVDVGCRRVTERLLSRNDPPTVAELERAHEACRLELSGIGALVAANPPAPERLVVCGGTVTSLVAMHLGLEPYDSSRVHLAQLTRADVQELERRMAAIPVARRRAVRGLQEKRAPIILGGIVVIDEILGMLGVDRLTVSESDLLYGLATVVGTMQEGGASPIAWEPAVVGL
ncbi:MAG: phosphatase [Atopobiaceae bacterium]|jgi:exopolyphosphatase/guanosine-5'-triphosphate,3'-diphosphate pyrophosphatase|nr:phosphatase [Atopobiaceae bacterium]MCH4119796.1 phosphatase [Atopobiaceae bacterium]MCI1318328.1 phosphatase [Atopobiaceae bacterium]MCI1388871.1 phosphatase [Atopobiaceae bacterium]MCI1432509.1 phosphatase [Atopobiaceae bacterium]